MSDIVIEQLAAEIERLRSGRLDQATRDRYQIDRLAEENERLRAALQEMVRSHTDLKIKGAGMKQKKMRNAMAVAHAALNWR